MAASPHARKDPWKLFLCAAVAARGGITSASSTCKSWADLRSCQRGVGTQYDVAVSVQRNQNHLPCFVPGRDTAIASTAAEHDNAVQPFSAQVQAYADAAHGFARDSLHIAVTSWQGISSASGKCVWKL